LSDREINRELEKRRQDYAKQVSQLRKQYAAEVAKQRATDEAAAEAKRREITRKRLEHERRKNLRSAQNAIRQKQIKEARDAEFAEELRITQLERDAKNARFARARQMVVDELEEVAHLWLTTPQEVENAFTWKSEQLLWARPNSVLGEENPSLDTEFWRYETHTWHMDKTYPTPRELLLQDMLADAYEEANVEEDFWTSERVAEREALERKAKLRAMVRDTGRRMLLNKQKEILQDQFSNEDKTQIPNPIPVPSLSMLTNTNAMEEEGASVLLKDPTKFFEFESDQTKEGSGNDDDDAASYQGPTLGAPVALKDFAAYGPHEPRPYPQPVGKKLKPDTRSEKQKLREERQKRMWAAAQEELSDEDKLNAQVEMAVEKTFGGSIDIDYSNPPDYDSDDEAWQKGLNSEVDADIISTPRDKRFTEEDIAWVMQELEKNINEEKKLLRFELANAMHDSVSKKEGEKLERELKLAGKESGGKEDVEVVQGKGDSELRSLGVNVDQLNSVLESLTEEQMFSFLSMEELESNDLSQDEISNALKTVPGLTDEQIEKIVQLEASLANNEKIRAKYGEVETPGNA
jgi:hypothetical protein